MMTGPSPNGSRASLSFASRSLTSSQSSRTSAAFVMRALNGGTYQINFHIEVSTTQTSGTKLVDVILPCAPTAVTVASLSADATDSSLNLALLALAGAGLVVLGGLVFVAQRKR